LLIICAGLQSGNIIVSGKAEGCIGEESEGGKIFFSALICGTTITIFDLTTDPSLLRRGYWNYAGGGLYYGVPLVNFLGWLVLGFTVAFVVLHLLARNYRTIDAVSPPKHPQSTVLRLVEVSAFVASASTFTLLGDPAPLRLNLAFGSAGILVAMLARMWSEWHSHTADFLSPEKTKKQ